MLPAVVICTVPDADGVHCHHTDLPPVLPAWLGSPLSLVAPTLLPVTVAPAAATVIRLAELSFAGPTGSSSVMVTVALLGEPTV